MRTRFPKRATVLGAARSGLAVAKLLQRQGYEVFVSDLADVSEKAAEAKALAQAGIRFEFGRHSGHTLETDLLAISPGIPPASEIVQQAKSKNLPVLSELEIASWFCPGPIIAVTGTNGKSTTTAWIGEMFKQAGRKHVVAGNIGRAFSEAVTEMDAETTAIVEVSSFQLEAIRTFRPHCAALLNLTPDHLNRYDSFETYARTKLRIFENQTGEDFAIFNSADPVVSHALESAKPKSRLIPFSELSNPTEGCLVSSDRIRFALDGRVRDILNVHEVSLPGQHNRLNALAATSTAMLAGIPSTAVANALRTFKGLEHRLELVREVSGVTFVNDSKATNLNSLICALQSFERSVILIAGGKNKGEDFSSVRETILQRVKLAILLGETASSIAAALTGDVECVQVANLAEAVRQAQRAARPGDVVLLSPGCASFDMFRDFEDRGQQFKNLVEFC